VLNHNKKVPPGLGGEPREKYSPVGEDWSCGGIEIGFKEG